MAPNYSLPDTDVAGTAWSEGDAVQAAQLRRFIVFVAIVVSIMAVASPAFAAAPTLGTISPADGTRFTGGFTVSFSASDPDGLSRTASVTVAGKTYAPTCSYAGYWDGDGCDSWWVEDPTQGSYACTIADPGPGVHQVTVTVTDAIGESTTRQFSITRTAALSFAAQSPIPGSSHAVGPAVSVLVSGSSIATSSALVTVDGAPIASTCELDSAGRALVTAGPVVGTGTHSVTVSVGDGTSAPPATTTWTFTVSAASSPPLIGAPQPAAGSTVQGPFVLRYRVTDPQRVDGARARLFIDGSTVIPASVTYAGYWTGDGCDEWWVEDRTIADLAFSVPDLGPGPHSFRLEVGDASSNWTSAQLTLLRSAALSASGQSPAAASRVRTADAVRVTLSGGAVDPTSVQMTVDGTVVTPVFEPTTDGGVVSLARVFSEGTHSVEVVASDTSGSPPMATQWTFVVDSTPPVVRITSPSAGATMSLADSGIAVRIEDADTVVPSSVTLTLDGTAAVPVVTADAAGLSIQRSGVLAEGAHSATITARDVAGNEVVYSWGFVVADPPRFGALSPTTLVGRDVHLTAAASDVNADLDPNVRLTVDGNEAAAVLQLTTARQGTVAADVSNLAHGRHTAVAEVKDAFGNVATKSWSFDVDALAPTLEWKAPSSGATLKTHAVSLGALFTDSGAVDPAKAAAWLDGQPVSVSAFHETTWVGDGCDAYEVADTGRLHVNASLNLHDGPHTVRVKGADTFGQETVEEWSFTVAEPPVMTNVSPLAGTHTTASNVTVSATVSDFDGVAVTSIEWRSAGDSLWTAVPSTYDAVTGLLSGTFTFPAAEAAYEFRLSARDSGGLTVERQTVVFVDGAPPVLETSSRAPVPARVLTSHQVAFGARFTDSSTIDLSKTTASIDGVPVPVGAEHEGRWVGTGCDAYWEEFPGTLAVSGSRDLHDGPHTVRITAVDEFGYEASSEWSFTVAEPPTIADITPASGLHTEASGITVSAKVSDFDGVGTTSVDWRASGSSEASWTTLSSDFDPATGLLSAQFTFPVAEKGYDLRFTVTDEGGLSTTGQTSVFADAAAPDVNGASILPRPQTAVTSHRVTFSGRFDDESTIDPAKTLAWIDGQQAPVSAWHDEQWIGDGCDAYSVELPGTLLFSGTADLHDGPHTVRVRAVDIFGFETTHQWSFTVRETPTVSGLVPAAGTRTTESSMVVSAAVSDFDGIQATEIAWREANTGRPAGAWTTADSSYSSVAGKLAAGITFPRDDTRYEVRFTATDAGGLTTTATTNLFVAADSEHVQAGTECSSCHASILQTHPMADCIACHGTASGPCDCHGTGVHGTWLLQGATVDEHGGLWTGRTCTDCHSHSSDVEAQRHGSGLESKCAPCHEQALTAEHASRLDGTAPFTCSSCHASTDPLVTAAIAANRTDCAACHPLGAEGGHESVHVVPPGERLAPYDIQCAACHDDNLMSEHARASSSSSQSSCDACHPSPRDTLQTAWGGACSVAGCHVPGSSEAMHGAQEAAHGSSTNAQGCASAGCHANDLAAVHTEASTGTGTDVRTGCLVCHGDGVQPASGTCTDCHTSAPHPAARHSVAGPCSTAGCHETDLAAIHTTPGCESCHGPARVSSWSCVECHSVSTHLAADHRAATGCDPGLCHRTDDLIAIHAGDCGTCHPSPRSSFSTWDKSCEQAGCHVAPHEGLPGYEQHGHTGLPESSCQDCHADEECEQCHYSDRQPPVTVSDARATYNGAALIRLTATDVGGRGLTTYYRLDGGPIQVGVSILVPSTESTMTHAIEFWSVDVAGMVEDHHVVRFTVYPGAPEPPTTTSDAVASYTGTATIALTAADHSGYGIKATYYSVDGGAAKQGTTVVVPPPRSFAETHTVRFWSVDNVNTTESAKSVTFRVNALPDTVPPVTSSDAAGAYTGPALIRLTATDAGWGVDKTYYRLDGGPMIEGSSAAVPAPTSGTASHTIEFWSVDKAGNVEAPPKTKTFTISAGGGTGTIRFLWFEAPDGSWFEYRVFERFNDERRLVVSGTNTTGYWSAIVPVSPVPYELEVDFQCPGEPVNHVAGGSATVSTPGAVVDWWY